ncbi:hypothetical protein EYF80_000419 [Liparis tanakae]|uniref:Uncharacterized protein n=1 Tax=Liparis tanakae TaxID=230148 RepID=A0A4Z2JGN0_9TELE|nr:hypothetical protein EYF80_000419 [Liparis tanakae]
MPPEVVAEDWVGGIVMVEVAVPPEVVDGADPVTGVCVLLLDVEGDWVVTEVDAGPDVGREVEGWMVVVVPAVPEVMGGTVVAGFVVAPEVMVEDAALVPVLVVVVTDVEVDVEGVELWPDTNTDGRRSASKGLAAIPGSPDRTANFYQRLTKTEKELLSLKTRVACERASWEMRFAELQRKQGELLHQLASQAGPLVRVDDCDEHEEPGLDRGDAMEGCSSK